MTKKVGNTLEHIRTEKDFLNRTSVAQSLRTETDQKDHIKVKSFFTVKNTINRVKRQSIE